VEFQKVFQEEFCPKKEAQLALSKLETTGYHQGKRSMDKYIDEFRDLVDQAGYMEGLGIVAKFWKGMQRDIQDVIAQLPVGRPEDDNSKQWYAAAT